MIFFYSIAFYFAIIMFILVVRISLFSNFSFRSVISQEEKLKFGILNQVNIFYYVTMAIGYIDNTRSYLEEKNVISDELEFD